MTTEPPYISSTDIQIHTCGYAETPKVSASRNAQLFARHLGVDIDGVACCAVTYMHAIYVIALLRQLSSYYRYDEYAPTVPVVHS